MKDSLYRVRDRVLEIKDRCGWKNNPDVSFVLVELMNLCDEVREIASLVLSNIKDDALI